LELLCRYAEFGHGTFWINGKDFYESDDTMRPFTIGVGLDGRLVTAKGSVIIDINKLVEVLVEGVCTGKGAYPEDGRFAGNK